MGLQSQGRPSFLRPTLGFGTESRWDSDAAAYELHSKLPVLLPQRGFIFQPRVGPPEGLPWVTMRLDTNPTGVVSDKTSSLADVVRGEMVGGK